MHIQEKGLSAKKINQCIIIKKKEDKEKLWLLSFVNLIIKYCINLVCIYF